MRIIVNGVGVAGPTLAYWLRQAGHEVLLVEAAPRLRSGGYVIDFWGIGYDIAERMGLLPRIRERGYAVQDVRFVDSEGRIRGGFEVAVFGRLLGDRFTSLRRSDLAAILYDALEGRVETIFGDSIAAIEQTATAVAVSFDRSSPREADLVVGADGLHSRVRRLAFGAEGDFEVGLGYWVAAFEAQGYRPRDELVYVSHAAPGRQVSRFSMRDDTTLFLFVFRDQYAKGPDPTTDAERRAVLASVFSGMGWECPAILAAAQDAGEIYFDRVSQIRMRRWTNGRIALVGDAAACASLLAGEGTGLAMAEAYALAGELVDAGGDHASAFSRYEARLMPFVARKQAAAAKFASSFAPKTSAGIAFRDVVTRLMRVPWIAEYFVGRDLRDDVELPRYRFR